MVINGPKKTPKPVHLHNTTPRRDIFKHVQSLPLKVTVEIPSSSTKFDVSQETARKSCNLGCHDLFFHLWHGLQLSFHHVPMATTRAQLTSPYEEGLGIA